MRSIFTVLAGSIASAMLCASAYAQVHIEQPWARATVPGQQVTGAFMQLSSSRDSTLVSAHSPLAKRTEIHEMTMVDDVMKMREVPGVALPAGKTVELMPGGYHIMLMQLSRQLNEGDQVPLTLTFEAADGARTEASVEATVRSLAAGAGHGGAKSHHGAGHEHANHHRDSAAAAPVQTADAAHDHAAHGGHGHGHDGHAQVRQYPDPASVSAPRGVVIQECWIRALPGNLPSAAYFLVSNEADHDVTLLDVMSSSHAKTMLHATTSRDGMSSMQAAGDVVVPAKQTLKFAPGGYHVMLEEPKTALRVGDTLPLVFWFKADQALTAPCQVKPANTLG